MDFVPNFTLYGEDEGYAFPDLLHCETISERSRIHDWHIRPHRHHELYQFFWMASGVGRIFIEDRDHPLAPPMAVLVPPLTVHGFDYDHTTEGLVITVPAIVVAETLGDRTDLLSRLSSPAVLPLAHNREESREIERLFAAVATEHGQNRDGRGQSLRYLTGLVALWFSRLIGAFEAQAPDHRDNSLAFVHRLQQLIDSRFRDGAGVQDYADLLGVTPTHLSRLCRETIGRPASALIHERRLLEARRLLVYTTMSVSQIAYELGFQDPAYFSKFFARKMGCTPSGFRERFLPDGADASPSL